MTEKKVPVRTCIACRRESEKKQLYRIVRNKDGEVFLDRTGKANGRGAYFCGDAKCLAKIKKANMLKRALAAEIPEEVYAALAEIANER